MPIRVPPPSSLRPPQLPSGGGGGVRPPIPPRLEIRIDIDPIVPWRTDADLSGGTSPRAPVRRKFYVIQRKLDFSGFVSFPYRKMYSEPIRTYHLTEGVPTTDAYMEGDYVKFMTRNTPDSLEVFFLNNPFLFRLGFLYAERDKLMPVV